MAKKTYLKPSGVISGGTEPGFTLNKLRHDDFHAICGLTQDVKIMRPDVQGLLSDCYVLTPDGLRGIVSGYAVDADTDRVSKFARVNGRLYREDALRITSRWPLDA